MDTTGAVQRLEATLQAQVAISGDPAVEAAGQALVAAVAPAMRQLTAELAEQAAAEVDAQLVGQRVEVVLSGGEPHLRVAVEPVAAPPPIEDEDQARVTLRVPAGLKSAIEDAANSAGDSLNTWMVKGLAGMARRGEASGHRVKGTVRT